MEPIPDYNSPRKVKIPSPLLLIPVSSNSSEAAGRGVETDKRETASNNAPIAMSGRLAGSTGGRVSGRTENVAS